MIRPVLGVDIDDVMFSWYDEAHALCVEAGITNGVTPTSWQPYLDYPCEQQVWLDTVSRMVDRGTYLKPPIEGAVEALHRLFDSGLFEIHLVTSRGGFTNGVQIKLETVHWIARYDVPHHGLHFTQDKTRVGTDISVDDHARHITALDRAGVETYLIDRPYNQELDHPRRFATFADVADDLIERWSK